MLKCGNIRITCCDVEVAEKGWHHFLLVSVLKVTVMWCFISLPPRSGILIEVL